MKKKNTIRVERCIQLENWIKENEFKNMNLKEEIELMFSFPEEEKNYIFDAKTMPKEEIERAVEYYDSHRWLNTTDELLFTSLLASQYGVNRERIIKRIQDVRRIKREENVKV
ncbi:MAG: hypothetical protein IJ272_06190, partial [Clostridia bacterium]|nr:hypothetical protein [Clostridia bacterium]